jgi:glycine reductase
VPIQVVHYLNQFFAGIGGEEAANHDLRVSAQPEGAARALVNLMAEDAELKATIICGDNTFSERTDEVSGMLFQALKDLRPDVIVAGPAFGSGRYGLACSHVSHVAAKLDIPTVTGMHPENPGLRMYRSGVLAVRTEETATDMKRALSAMWSLAHKLGAGEDRGPAEIDGYIPTGERRPWTREQSGSKRATDMLLTKLRGEHFETEVPYRIPEKVTPAPPINDVATATIGLISSGGLIPKGNPHGATNGHSQHYYRHSVDGMESLERVRWEVFHGGYFNGIVNENPNYVLPLAQARQLESQGKIGQIFNSIFTTAGTGTPVAQAKVLGRDIARELQEGEVDGVLLVAT